MTCTRAAPLPRAGGDQALAALLVVLAHAALLLAWRQHARLPDPHDPPRIEVRLLPMTALDEPATVRPAVPAQRRQAPSRPVRPAAVGSPPVQGEIAGESAPAATEPASAAGPSAVLGPRLGDAARAAGIAAPTLAERARAQLPGPAGGALERGVAAAARADCKDAYSDLVLLAIPRLVIDTVRDKGCRWK